MPLSRNEIKKRAVAFSRKWENETCKNAEAKSFWDGLFNASQLKGDYTFYNSPSVYW